jgi:hypothetical protein
MQRMNQVSLVYRDKLFEREIKHGAPPEEVDGLIG